MSDITDRKAAEEQLRHDALHDALTGLPNRTLFLDRLAAVAAARPSASRRSRCAVLFLDLDRFKLVNDGFSHAVGDQLLVAMARRLAARPAPGRHRRPPRRRRVHHPARGRIERGEAAVEIAERIHASLREPFLVDGQQLSVTASIGIAISEAASDPARAAPQRRHRDVRRQDRRRRRSRVFDVSMRSRVVAQLQVETELRARSSRSALRDRLPADHRPHEQAASPASRRSRAGPRPTARASPPPSSSRSPRRPG